MTKFNFTLHSISTGECLTKIYGMQKIIGGGRFKGTVSLEFLKLKSPGGGEKWIFDFWQNE